MNPSDDRLTAAILETQAVEPQLFFEIYRDWSQERRVPLAEHLVEGGHISTQDLAKIRREHFNEATTQGVDEPGQILSQPQAHSTAEFGPASLAPTVSHRAGEPLLPGKSPVTRSDSELRDRYVKVLEIVRGG